MGDTSRPLHGILIVAGFPAELVAKGVTNLISVLNNGKKDKVVVEIGREVGAEREGKENKGHEHFGSSDGISHPKIKGIDGFQDLPDVKLGFELDKVSQPKDASNTVEPGVIIVGRSGDRPRTEPQALSRFGNDGGKFELLGAKPQWMKDGSFPVFRKLEQDVEKWNNSMRANFAAAGCSNDRHLGAKLMGRWQIANDKTDGGQTKESLRTDNNFDFGTSDKCPAVAHIRKAHIRHGIALDNQDGDPKGSTRIMRRGIPYGKNWVPGTTDTNRGLLFACYQSTIEDGYRFIQSGWTNNPNSSEKGDGFDVTIGQATGEAKPFKIGTNTISVKPVNEFVKTKGREYFFALSKPFTPKKKATPLRRRERSML